MVILEILVLHDLKMEIALEKRLNSKFFQFEFVHTFLNLSL